MLPGCGGSGGNKIPSDTAKKLTDNIQAADTYNSQNRCTRAHTKVRDAQFVLEHQVPSSVKASVRQGLADGLARLDSLISSECQPPTQTQTTTTQSQTTTTPSVTTPTTTTPSTTTPTTTTPSTTTPSTTTPTTTTPTGTGTGTTTGNGGTPTSTGGAGQ
jgi:hypothetical protein